MHVPCVSDFLRRLLLRPAPIRPGLYHCARDVEGTTARFHLRVDPAGGGLLLANGAAIRRLDPYEVAVAKGLFDFDFPAMIARTTQKSVRGASVSAMRARLNALDAVIKMDDLFKKMASPDKSYPYLNLVDPAFSARSLRWERPISADLPLCPPFFMARILDRLWELAIPHVTIIVGRDPDEVHMIRALKRATELGMIAGVRGRGSDLCRPGRISEMAAAGLYHLDTCCLSETDAVHDSLAGPGDHKMALRALGAAQRQKLCAAAQIALVRSTLPTIDATFKGLASHGLKNVCMFAIATTDPKEALASALSADELAPALRGIEESADRVGLRLAWYPTVRFDSATPLSEQVCRGPRCGGEMAIRVEPDGSVFAAGGPYRPAGNLFNDDWETISRSKAYQDYRRRVESETRCDQCPGLAICATDCPRDPAGWAEAKRGTSNGQP